MYELIKVNENDYYIDCPAKIGLVKVADDEVILIDSGSDKDAGKKALHHIEENGWKLRAIYNTHGHADHIGGNNLLQTRTGCRIFARGVERDFTNHTILEPVMLFGGFPPEELFYKFTCAKESVAEELNEESLPDGFKLLPLNGHAPDMVGIVTPDGTAYVGDVLVAEDTLKKYAISYVFNVEQYLQSLEFLKTVEAKVFVPAHAPAAENVSELIDYNIKVVNEIADKILELIKVPCNFDVLMKRIFDEYGIKLNILQYSLLGSTVKGYLQWLRKQKKADYIIEENEILWKVTE